MIERGFVDLYSAVCQEFKLDERERRQLWFEIVKEIDRVEDYLGNSHDATDEQIRDACRKLRVPTFRTLAENIRRMRTTTVMGGVTHADLKQVAVALAQAYSRL